METNKTANEVMIEMFGECTHILEYFCPICKSVEAVGWDAIKLQHNIAWHFEECHPGVSVPATEV